MSRREELTESWQHLQDRVARAASAAGRSPAQLTVIAVSKTWPATDVAHLVELGVRDFGENRDAEARLKATALAGLPVRWHFVGAVQSNKAASVAGYADVVHSVDRFSLLTALSAGAVRAGRTVAVLVQASLDGAPGRGGAAPETLVELAVAAQQADGLTLAGVMAVAPQGADPAQAFAELARLAAQIRAVDAQARWMSAGMSSDLEAAIAAGATHLRVGAALFGPRPPILR